MIVVILYAKTFSGDYGRKDVVAISLHRMALTYVSLWKCGARI